MTWLAAILKGLTTTAWMLYPWVWGPGEPTPWRRYYSLPTLHWCLDGYGRMPGCYTRWDSDADGDVDLRDVAAVYASPMSLIQGG